MQLSENELENLKLKNFDKLRAYTVAVSNPSQDFVAGSPIAKALSHPATNSTHPVNIPSSRPSTVAHFDISRAEAEGSSLQGQTSKLGTSPRSEKVGKSEDFETEKSGHPNGNDSVLSKGNGLEKVDVDDTGSVLTHVISRPQPLRLRDSLRDLISLHPLDAILPLSKPSGDSLEIRKENSKTLQFKEWVLEARLPALLEAVVPRPKKTKWILVGASVLVLILVGCLIPAIFFAVRGSRLSVSNYFNSIPTDEQTSLALKLLADSKARSARPVLSPYLNSLSDPIFDGIVYSPKNTMEPTCGFTLQDAILDLALLSSVTKKVRIYGIQCNQAAFILDAIQQLDLDMTVMMGVWISDDESHNHEQIKEAKVLLSVYPQELFDGVFVGNEVLFRNDVSELKLLEYIADLKQFVAEKNLKVPVGTAEIGLKVSAKLIAGCDVLGVNLLPFFTGLDSLDAAQWILDYLDLEILPLNTNTSIVISEVGWPFSGGVYHDSVADPENYQNFLQKWTCGALKELTGVSAWYYYEAFDEPWKAVFHDTHNQWETEWGIFGRYRDMKTNVSFPTCN